MGGVGNNPLETKKGHYYSVGQENAIKSDLKQIAKDAGVNLSIERGSVYTSKVDSNGVERYADFEEPMGSVYVESGKNQVTELHITKSNDDLFYVESRTFKSYKSRGNYENWRKSGGQNQKMSKSELLKALKKYSDKPTGSKYNHHFGWD